MSSNSPIDRFTQERLKKWITEYRKSTGQFPTLTDLETAHFDRSMIDRAVRSQILEEHYVTQTNGVIRKGYSIREKSVI